MTETVSESAWWRHAVIYQVYLRSFADGNGDGVGDLAGLRARLGHLEYLGVHALWVTPFYPSPMVDGGYDVADYRDVDPMFGDLGEVDALLGDAHARGLRVIVDLVPNHTSSRHAWFTEALAAGPGSHTRDRYIFRDGRGYTGDLPPNDWESVFGGPAWTRVSEPDGTPGQWYLHLFAAAQPDLNWEHPDVHAEFDDVLRFWLDRGVDGVRVDVAHGMVKAPGLPDAGRTGQVELLGKGELPYFDQDRVHEIYRRWRKILDSYPGERIGVAEAWAPTADRLARYVRPDELHQAFNFHYVRAGWSATEFRAVIDESLATADSVGAASTWVLSNHDIQRHVSRFGGGTRGLRRARAATLLTLALPGAAYLYQGEELGLPEVGELPPHVGTDPQRNRADGDPGRDGCRVPMPWSGDEPPFGFTDAAAAWLPQPGEWRDHTVAAQQADPASTLTLYRAALRLRATTEALRSGELRWRNTAEEPNVLVFERSPGFVCTVNFDAAPVDIAAPGRLLLTSIDPAELRVDGETVTLPPECAAWWDGPGTQ